jgi:hypothetical protein
MIDDCNSFTRCPARYVLESIELVLSHLIEAWPVLLIYALGAWALWRL